MPSQTQPPPQPQTTPTLSPTPNPNPILSDPSPSSFSLLATLRYSPFLLHSPQNSLCSPNPSKGSPFYLLQYQRDRLRKAAGYFGWEDAARAVDSEEVLEAFLQGKVEAWVEEGGSEEKGESCDLRIRLLLSQNGTLTATITPTPTLPLSQLFPSTLNSPYTTTTTTTNPSPPPPIPIYLSAAPTPPTPHTHFKTTHRLPYDHARLLTSLPGLPTPSNPSEVLLHSPSGHVTEGSLTSVYFFRGGGWVTPGNGQEGVTRRWAVEGGGLCKIGEVRVDAVKEGEEVWVSNGVRGFGRGRVDLGRSGNCVGENGTGREERDTGRE